MPTFNRALQKFTQEYNATLATVSTATTEKKPVTRDVEVSKAQPEAEPAPVLDLIPPAPVSEKRVANDPRERRRLAKLAAEQALQQAKQQAQAEAESTAAEPAAEATAPAEEAKAENTEAAPAEAPVAAVESADTTEATQTPEPAAEAPVETAKAEQAPAEAVSYTHLRAHET